MDYKTKGVLVKDLKPGMVIAFTKNEVLTHPTAGISTERNKMDFVVKTPKGTIMQKGWNRNTIISIMA